MAKADHPLASPIMLTEEFVSGSKGDKRFPLKWPRSMLAAGSRDPLYDGTLRMMERMVESKVECECTVYEGLPHGFFGMSKLLKQGDNPGQQAVQQLKRLMRLQ